VVRTSEAKLRSFARDSKGNVALLFGFALIPLLLSVGVAVDYGRALIVRERLQDAIDSAGLGVGSWVGLSPADMKTKAQQYFDANYPSSVIGTVTQLDVSSTGNRIEVTAKANVPTTFMKLANFDSIGISAKTTISVGMGTIEVALALDNSGSMLGNKIAALKDAASKLVDTLFAASQYSVEPEPLKIAVVPFAAGVNVGSQYANESWMDTGSQSSTHADAQKAYGAPTTTNNFTLFSSLKTSSGAAISWGGCVEARPIPYDVSDDAPSTGTPSTLFVPMFAPDEPDNWTCTSTSSSGSGACPLHACADGGSNCSSSSASLVYNGAPAGSYSYNNYLPDAGGDGTSIGPACSTVTITTGSPATINKTAHGFVAGDQVVFATTGSLPSGLTKTTRYYVLSSNLTANSFRVSTTNNGSAINASGSQSGIHFIANTFTCRTGSANCARTGGSGGTVGRSEQDGFAGKAVPSNLNCKYGTSTNKATVSDVTVGGIPGGPNFMCTSAPLMPLSTDKAAVKNAINAMQAQGATGVVEGAMWGWRTLSPGEPFAQGRSYNTEKNHKVLVLMTDGQNTYYPNTKFLKSWYDIYGYVERGRLGTTSTNQATLTNAMDDRTELACANIKQAGVIIYTVAFQIPGDQLGALDLLKGCATDEDKYFAPNTESELLSAFNAIGQDIAELRISE
jgi:Flp pilus assembly protein TadG